MNGVKIIEAPRMEVTPGVQLVDLNPPLLPERCIVVQAGSSYRITGAATLVVSAGALDTVIALRTASTGLVRIRNASAGAVTIDPAGSTVDGSNAAFAMVTTDIAFMQSAEGIWYTVEGS